MHVHGADPSESPLHVLPHGDGSMTVSVNGVQWLRSVGAWLHSGGQVYSSLDGSLKLGSISPLSGTDRSGNFTGVEAKWQARDGTAPRRLSVIRTYAVDVSGKPTHRCYHQAPRAISRGGRGISANICCDQAIGPWSSSGQYQQEGINLLLLVAR